LVMNIPVSSSTTNVCARGSPLFIFSVNVLVCSEITSVLIT
jgi:hypothetical protein